MCHIVVIGFASLLATDREDTRVRGREGKESARCLRQKEKAGGDGRQGGAEKEVQIRRRKKEKMRKKKGEESLLLEGQFLCRIAFSFFFRSSSLILLLLCIRLITHK